MKLFVVLGVCNPCTCTKQRKHKDIFPDAFLSSDEESTGPNLLLIIDGVCGGLLVCLLCASLAYCFG